ncbi:MAG: malto-oligosyltrehalose trehalohydrolase [Gemmatimonadota bacterium]
MRTEPDEGLGAIPLADGRCRFRVFAPAAASVSVRQLSPRERSVALEKDAGGYHAGVVEGVGPGALYFYRLDGRTDRPDPASRFQPRGVHGPSQVVDRRFPWRDDGWTGPPLEDYLFYEIHVGTFTPAGTFEAVIPHLDALAHLGVTALELMPVAQFPGRRNWGYDGVFPFAVQDSYGGPGGLKGLVGACHARGLAVVLDVVYNHLGPEGNHLREFGPYFTDRYRTPWGDAINYDGPGSDAVRRFFIENALCWLDEFHVDALRLDAIHGIFDFSAVPFLAELSGAVRGLAGRTGRRIHLVAESDLNDARTVAPPERGGLGLDAQWNDDFHHALHVLLTGERTGYYRDFGSVSDLATALTDGFVYSGRYSACRMRRHGSSSRHLASRQLVVCSQNHDQVGNRVRGERLSALAPPDALKVAAAAVLLSPFLPLLFMGEEYGETAPFQYFVSHADPALVAAVRAGRKEEFAAFRWDGEPPDPQDETTFLRSRPDRALREQARHAVLEDFYRELIRLRREHPALRRGDRESMAVVAREDDRALALHRWSGGAGAWAVFRFAPSPGGVPVTCPPGRWKKRLDSSEERWGGAGSALPASLSGGAPVTLEMKPWAFVLYLQ